MLKRLLAALVATTFIIGCANLAAPDSPTYHVGAKITVQYATLKYIGDDQDKARRVAEFASLALSIAESEPASLAELSVQIQALIPYDRMELAERVLVANLAEAVVAELQLRVDVDPIVPIADVREVLGWVQQAAELAAPR